MRARWPVGVGCAALALLFGSVRAASAQDLSRKSPAAATAAGPCPTEPLPPPVSQAARTQAARLGTSATEAAILGEEARARSLLEQATALDPASAPLAAQLARLLESAGEEKGAVAAYCRYLALRPGAEDAGDVRDRIRMLAAAAAPPKTVASETPRAANPATTTLPAKPPATPPERVATTTSAPSRTAAPASTPADRKQTAPGATAPKTGQTTASASPRTGPAVPPARIDTAAAVARAPRRGSVAGPALLIPGLTQMVHGRPVVGVLFLGVAAGGVALGVLDKKVHVDCLAEPVGGLCPAGQARGSRTERPLLGAGLGIAGAALVIGAIEALVTGRPLPAGDAVRGSGPDASGHNPRLEVGVGPRAARVGISIATRSF